MPRLKSANFAVTELASGITNAATSFQVVDASLFPNEGPFIVLVHDSTPGFAGIREIMEVGSINKGTNTFSNVLRGREGTSAVAHSAGARAECVWTAGTHEELVDTDIKPARFVIGTSEAGWTEKDCDYLCDGTADQVEINQAIQDLPASGGEIIILDGVYNIENLIHIQKPNTKIKGNGKSTVLKRMFSNTINSGYIILRADYIIIEDITLDGNRNIFELFRNRIISTHPTVAPVQTNYSVIKNCFLKDGGGDYAISFNGNNNYVTQNLITNCKGYGVTIYNNENTISQNMIYDCDYGISVRGSNNLIASNICRRGEGLPSDYTASQDTIRLSGISSGNLVTSNLCLGKAVVDEGTSNTLANNKWE